MPERLTNSFTHLFELTRELSISLDQSGRHSRNDPAIMTFSDDPALERTSSDRPVAKNLGAQRARECHACFEGAFANGELAAPPSDPIAAPRAMQRRFDQGPA